MGRIARYFEGVFFTSPKGASDCTGRRHTRDRHRIAAHHRLPSTADFTLIVVIVILAGAFGGAIALIWRMTHIPEIIRAVEHAGDHQHERRKIGGGMMSAR